MTQPRENIELDALTARWTEAQRVLLTTLDALGATEGAHTSVIRMVRQEIVSPESFRESLRDEDGEWFCVSGANEKGKQFGLATPIRRPRAGDLSTPVAFSEIHGLLTAWWLMNAWRVRQLARAGIGHATSHDVIAAASCVRPLVETAAAFWQDGIRLRNKWDEVKRAGLPSTPGDAFGRRDDILPALEEVIRGSKFADPELKESFGRWDRVNVLTQVDKLAKVAGDEVQSDYQWLCNTVHPSLGNFIAFIAPMLVHRTGTTVEIVFCGRPLNVETIGSSDVSSERTIQLATARSALRALGFLQTCFDGALRFIDDVALTTGAPSVALNSYWRDIQAPADDGAPCPCRSGDRATVCRHAWGDAAPPYPQKFS